MGGCVGCCGAVVGFEEGGGDAEVHAVGVEVSVVDTSLVWRVVVHEAGVEVRSAHAFTAAELHCDVQETAQTFIGCNVVIVKTVQ